MAEGNRTAAGILLGGGAAVAMVAAAAALWSLGQDVPEPASSAPEPAAVPSAPEPIPQAAPVPPSVPVPEPKAATAAPPAPVAAPVPAPPVSPPVAAAPATPDPDPAAPIGQAPPAQSAPAAKAAVPPQSPPQPVARFDTLRVTPAGALTLAGDVAPGAKVELLLDGEVIDTVTANAQGAFAAVTSAEPSAAPRSLRLRVTGADGVAKMSEESLTVAPSPRALAEAATAEGAAPAAVAAQVEAAQVLADTPLLTDASGTPRLLAGVSETLVIDTLSFAPDGKITISGRGAPKGALLRAYVDNAEVGLVQAGGDGGFTLRLPAATPGPHALRLDALDAAGRVLARAEQGFEGVAPPPPAAAAAVAETAAPARSRIVTISSGNTLWAIARDTYGDPYLYVQIFEANRDQIRDPDRIYPGQVFTLPE